MSSGKKKSRNYRRGRATTLDIESRVHETSTLPRWSSKLEALLPVPNVSYGKHPKGNIQPNDVRLNPLPVTRSSHSRRDHRTLG